MERKSLENVERFRHEIVRSAFPKEEYVAPIVVDRWAPLGDTVEGSAEIWVETDIAVKGKRRRARGADRVPRMLFVGENRVVGPPATLPAGSQGDLR